jgi:hypothetical protein
MYRKTKKTHIVILDTSKIEDFVDYGGMLYELKENNICEGQGYQIDNGNDLLMDYKTYKKCKDKLDRF